MKFSLGIKREDGIVIDITSDHPFPQICVGDHLLDSVFPDKRTGTPYVVTRITHVFGFAENDPDSANHVTSMSLLLHVIHKPEPQEQSDLSPPTH